MQFKYLGTAAAEGWPAMFCNCDNCKRAAAAGGRNLRTRSQAIIDDRLLIDFPADTYMHVLHNGLNLTGIKTCIITHDHSDHLYAADLEMRGEVFAFPATDEPLTMYGTEPAGKKIRAIIKEMRLDKQGRVFFKRITPFLPFSADGYRITPLKADHDPACDPVFYSVSDGRKGILYAHDTGYFPDGTWSYLEKQRPYFDFVSLDDTCGLDECSHGHMGVRTAAEVKDRLIRLKMADERTLFCLNHFSHNSKAIYDELVPAVRKDGFLVSYDGMTIRL